RLDNVVYRMGFASSRRQARQLVRHRHVMVNGRIVDIPSYQTRPGDEIRVKPGSKDLLPVQAALESKSRPATVSWVAVDEETRTGRILERPARADIPLAVQEQLLAELYSKEGASCGRRARAAAARGGPVGVWRPPAGERNRPTGPGPGR